MTIHHLITDNLDIWTAADTEKKSGRGRSSGNAASVYGIKKLRELILELAVRGKLVPQDPNDEPASDLLKRIQTEKARLISEGKIKKDKPLLQIIDEEKIFSLPHGWEWVKLGLLSDIKGGKRLPAGTAFSNCVTPYIYIQVTNMKYGAIIEESLKYIDESTHNLIKQYTISSDDLYITIAGTIGDVGSVPNRFNGMNLNENAAKIVFTVISKEWFKCTLRSSFAKNQFSDKTIQMAQPKLALHRIADSVLALPPLSEQHRIVAKVDELMALCDQLETQHSNAAEAHEKLVSHLLGTLIQSQSAEDFSANWQRIAAHFDTLFTTEASIDVLKQTLLQLAVMGKLVPQDPSDEPASELLKRIQTEKAKLVTEGKIKKPKPLIPISDEEKPFVLPERWEWVRFGEISTIKSELVRPEDFPNVRQIAPDCIEKGTGRLTELRTVKESGIRGPNSRFYKGQIVYSKIRPSLSKAVLVDFDGLCSADMYPIDVFIDSQFMLKQILSECFLEQVRVAENRIKMPKLNQDSLTAFVLPLTPLSEQHRIIAKIDELMTICDQLKSRITVANQLQQKLADVMVEQAIS